MANLDYSIAKNIVTPFLKWPGGKRWLVSTLAPILESELSGTYYEPFVGAGAIFLALQPKIAVLSDTNGELINFLRTVRSHPEKVIECVWRWSNEEECFYRVRDSQPQSSIRSAARFLFLNRTCWGGVYRLNQAGKFNVPFGNSGRKICCKSQVLACAKLLRRAVLREADFELVMSRARTGDVIYADPPYTTRGENNGFVRYNERIFSWADQERLALAGRKARRRGVFVAISGLYHLDLLRLYSGWWTLTITRNSRISRTITGRKAVSEVVIFSRKPRCVPSTLQSSIVRIS